MTPSDLVPSCLHCVNKFDSSGFLLVIVKVKSHLLPCLQLMTCIYIFLISPSVEALATSHSWRWKVQ